MIVSQIAHIYDYMRNAYRDREYTTLVDPVSHKQYVECVIYTHEGTIVNEPSKGTNVDKTA